MKIDEIMERLERGEVLVLNDQIRSYITMDSRDRPDRFLMRRVLMPTYLDKHEPKLVFEDRYESLVEILLLLQEPFWQDADGNITVELEQ